MFQYTFVWIAPPVEKKEEETEKEKVSEVIERNPWWTSGGIQPHKDIVDWLV